MRKETSNQFTEGLIKDLNPINTPNTALTDALNATLITYDGNEYSLQNDRGNYPLENCKLKPNYIPVGLKEYGDILYIVSYNPLNNHVEIGTYPSPAEVVSSDEKGHNLVVESVIENAEYKNNSIEYSDLIEDCKMEIWTTDNEEDSKLYPGDEYKIDEINPSPYKYEELEYFIVDDNRQKYNISDLVVKSGKWEHVAWQIPGWLATQYRIGTFDDFNLNIRTMKVPVLSKNKPFSCKSVINFQFRISDPLFLASKQNTEDVLKTDIGIKIVFKKNNTRIIEEVINLSESEFLDWYGESKILWIDYDKTIDNLNFGDNLMIEATPIVNVVVNGITKTIEYDPFKESYNISLNSIGSYNDFVLANEIWKFYIEDDTPNSLYMEYNVTGPNVTEKDINLYCKILDINKTVVQGWTPVKNYSGISNQSIGILDFNENFKSENLYIIEFAFYEPVDDPSILDTISDLKSTQKLIIASQLFSDYVGEYSNFNDITFDDWTSKFNKSLSSGEWEINHSPRDIDDDDLYRNYEWGSDGNLKYTQGGRRVFDEEPLIKLWNNLPQDDKGWFTTDKLELMDKTVDFVIGKKAVEHIELEHTIKSLTGDLWSGAPDINIEVKASIGDGHTIKKYTRDEINSNKNLIVDLNLVYGQEKNYDYITKATNCYFISGLRHVENIPVMWLDIKSINLGGFNQGVDFSLGSCGELKSENQFSTTTMHKKNQSRTMRLGGGTIKIPNDISKSILSLLGNNDLGIIGIGVDSDTTAGKFEYNHGTDIIKQIDGKSNTYLFTYLVFRPNEYATNYAVLIPFDKDSGYWNVDLGTSGEDGWFINSNKLTILRDNLSKNVSNFVENFVICDDQNAITKGNVIEINTNGNISELPLFDIKVYSDETTKWIYKGSNLLNIKDRNTLINIIGKDVCGKLLSGSTKNIERVDFYSETIDEFNTNVKLDNLFDSIDKIVSVMNGDIDLPETQSGLLLDQMRTSTTTRGVYWLGDSIKNNDFIVLINNNYSYNKEMVKLCAGGANSRELSVYLTDDKDRANFAYVDTKTKVSLI